MANICDNIFYASSSTPENIEAIKTFFDTWKYEGGADYDGDNESCDVTFYSKWGFPYDDMEELRQSLPNKEDIYMRCLSYELENLYHALFVCDGGDWQSV